MAAEVKHEGRVYDVVVIGAGIAGWTAARRSQDLGASVVVVEKGSDGPGYGNALLSSAMVHAAYLDPRKNTPDEIYAQLMKKSEGHSRPDVTRAFADNAARAINYLIAEGAQFASAGTARFQQHHLQPGPVPKPSPADHWRERGPHQLLTTMWRSFVQGGGTFRPGTKAVDLATADGTVVGIYVEPSAGGPRELVRGRAVVMADGGFQADPELMRKHVTSQPGRYIILGSPTDTGDCMKMAAKLGAKLVELDTFYGNITLRDSLTNPELHHRRFAAPRALIDAAIVVNSRGERMGDEAYGKDDWAPIDPELATPLMRTDAPGDSWVIFDDETWETVGRGLIGGATPNAGAALNPRYVEFGGTLLTAPSIAELAHHAGMPADQLQRTVDAFNGYATRGTQITPPRTGNPRPISQGPFHAIPIIAGVFFTIGGVLVNERFQALDQGEQPIPGLYAAGGTCAGLGGGPRNAYAGGWCEAATSGLLAAESAVSGLRLSELTAAR